MDCHYKTDYCIIYPVLPYDIKSYMDIGVEQLQTGMNMVTKIKNNDYV